MNLTEAGLHGRTQYALLENGQISLHSFRRQMFTWKKYSEAIRGGSAKENAEILLFVLQNQASPYLETAVLDRDWDFCANGKSDSTEEGIVLARQDC